MSTLAAIGTFLVIGATAIAGAIQLRHLRVSNQFSSMLAVLERYEDQAFIQDSDFVAHSLSQKIEDPPYRESLEQPALKRREHPEARILGWYEWVGTMIKRGLLPEDAFLDLFADRVVRQWHQLEPVVAVMRRSRGPTLWENFEYLVARSQAWLENNPSSYPKGTPHVPIVDKYLSSDASRRGATEARAD